MGKWIKKIPAQVPVHNCDRPSAYKEKAAVGSIWECECGARWEFQKMNYAQRGGDSWETWNLLNAAEMKLKDTISELKS
jgi:hypothetical protein